MSESGIPKARNIPNDQTGLHDQVRRDTLALYCKYGQSLLFEALDTAKGSIQ